MKKAWSLILEKVGDSEKSVLRFVSYTITPGNREVISPGFLTLSYGMLGYVQYLFFYWIEYYFKNELKLPSSQSP